MQGNFKSFKQNPTPWFGEGVIVNEIGNSIFVALDFNINLVHLYLNIGRYFNK